MTGGELAVVLEQHGRRVKPKRAGTGWMAQCPAHVDGKHLSLSISHGREGRYLLHCFAGCSFDEIRSALNLPAKAFFGWRSYNRKRCCSTSGLPSLTSTIRGVSVLNGPVALKAVEVGRVKPAKVSITVPARGGRVVRAVAVDMALLFGVAVPEGLPVVYSARWAGRRLGVDHGSVSRAVRSLTADGSIVVDRTIPMPGKRALRLYRLPGGAS